MIPRRPLISSKLIYAKKGLTNVASVKDAKKAMNVLEMGFKGNAPVSLMFVDWNMPEMNGIELLELVRKDERFNNIPFIMVTAENDPKQVKLALEGGVNNYILKPFTAETIFAKIVQTLKNNK